MKSGDRGIRIHKRGDTVQNLVPKTKTKPMVDPARVYKAVHTAIHAEGYPYDEPAFELNVAYVRADAKAKRIRKPQTDRDWVGAIIREAMTNYNYGVEHGLKVEVAPVEGLPGVSMATATWKGVMTIGPTLDPDFDPAVFDEEVKE